MEIRIGKTTRACARSNQAFTHGQELVSLVRPGEDGLVREDFAKDIWNESFAENAIAVWATTYVDPDSLHQESNDAHSPLRRSFYEAVESENRADLARAYLAAQLLRRQKVFRLIKEGENSETDEKFTLFTDRIDDRMIEVRDPNLSYAELNTARTELMELLNALEAPDPEETVDETGETEPAVIADE